MAFDPCSPDELSKAAEALAAGKHGETEITSITEDAGKRVTDNVSWTRTGQKMGHFHSFRTQIGAWGDEFAVRVLQPLMMNNITAESFVTKQYVRYKEALAPLELDNNIWSRIMTGLFGIPAETEAMLNKAVRLVNSEGDFMGATGSFPEHIVQTARNIKKLYNNLSEEYGVDPTTFFQWRDLYYKRPTGVIRDPKASPADDQLRSRITEGQMGFYDELERKGIVGESDATATADFLAFLHGLANAKIRKPFIERVEEEFVNPYLNRRPIKMATGEIKIVGDDPIATSSWEELKNHIFGGPTPMDRILTYEFEKLNRLVYGATGIGSEKPLDVRFTYRVTQGITSLFYAGTLGMPGLGGRPGSVIRQLAQIVPTYAELGAKYTMQGLKAAMTPGSIQNLRDRNILSSPVEAILESVSVARGTGRAISAMTENSLKMFSLADQFTRAATAYGKEAMFNDYQALGKLGKLPMHKELKAELMPLIGQGKLDEARDRFMFDGVANLQYVYGKANRPEIFRGAIGSMAGIFMSYPLNTVEMLRLFVKDALPEGMGGSGNPMPLIRLMGLTATLLYAGSEMLDVDMRSAFAIGALPTSMAFPKLAADTFSAGKTNYEWLTGNTFLVGETDYHKKERLDANRYFLDGMKGFVPGGTFVFSDLPRTIDEGTLVRLLGATPKADALNEAARRRSKEAREQSQQTGGIQPLRGIQP